METASKCKLNVKCITFNEMGRGGRNGGRRSWKKSLDDCGGMDGTEESEEEEVNKVGNAGQNSLL